MNKGYSLQDLIDEFGGHWTDISENYYDCLKNPTDGLYKDNIIVAYYIKGQTFHRIGSHDKIMSVEDVKRQIRIETRLAIFK